MRLASADGNSVRRLGAAALALGMGALSWSMYAAGPAAAAGGRGSLSLSPNNGPADTTFTATFHLSGTANCAGAVQFSFDGAPVSSAGIGGDCSASASIQVPLGASGGAHRVRAVDGIIAAAATFTVDGGGGQPPTNPQPPASNTGQNPGQQKTTTTSLLINYWNNNKTPTTPWTAPPFAAKPASGVTPGPCDTTGPHAPSADKSFLSIPAYSVGASTADPGGSVSEPTVGALPILSVGPQSMLPPQLGVAPYQSMELMEPVNPAISPKLRLAAAAGEPFSCLQVETFGAAGSGYGYLVFALKGALVISVQDANADGTPFVQTLPTVASVADAGRADLQREARGRQDLRRLGPVHAVEGLDALDAGRAEGEVRAREDRLHLGPVGVPGRGRRQRPGAPRDRHHHPGAAAVPAVVLEPGVRVRRAGRRDGGADVRLPLAAAGPGAAGSGRGAAGRAARLTVRRLVRQV